MLFTGAQRRRRRSAVMAAKVVMVAVPTVLGVASIRVYTVREAPADGLVTREKLNIYTPLPQPAQAQFEPERPGVIERGLTAARESILPLAQAAKGACVSVKRGSVNLYHAGEDVFYYLKDPPPGFLPRFGTVTMAGLLGMFLARKGSRFKRVAVPLGLMSAGASVCYPAQAVAVLKVTGKRLYAAGQWSRATVSSLLASERREPAASPPQSAAASNPESTVTEASELSSTKDDSTQSAAIPETDAQSAESVSISDEPVVADATKEASSAAVAEVSPDQAPAETSTDPAVHSVPAETETALSSEEPQVPLEGGEPSDAQQAAAEVSHEASSVEPAASLESGAGEVAPVDLAPVELAPVELAPAESAPAESAPAEPAEVESALSSEEPADNPAAPVVDPAEPEPDAQPEFAEQPPVASVEEETLVLTPPPPPPPPPEQPAAESITGGSSFKPDPSLMDFGQSDPEDADLYSTRS